MADPITIALATAVVTGVAGTISEHASEAVSEGLKRLQRAVFKRFRGDDAAQEAMDEARLSPQDPAAMGTLAEFLERAAAADPEIADLMNRLGTYVGQDGEGNTTNRIHGDVSDRAKVVQARDVQGDIHL
ncbi:hypothetical protein [Nocardiopsis sp. CC223A]|uniref:hypothetical protein n=1 Tax=Nocardiopsis sp. CC223A TaxID=3044051 RepID=UPI00278C8B90|nr:hypothetical protein [Nocardiopsis sp. CC223A]